MLLKVNFYIYLGKHGPREVFRAGRTSATEETLMVSNIKHLFRTAEETRDSIISASRSVWRVIEYPRLCG